MVIGNDFMSRALFLNKYGKLPISARAVHGGNGVVVQVSLEPQGVSIRIHFVVFPGAFPDASSVVKQSQTMIGIPVSMANPSSQKPDFGLEIAPIYFWQGELIN